VARCSENVLQDGDTFIVQKGEHLDNKGREASSYLWFIVNFYDDLSGEYGFRQGGEAQHGVGEFKFKCRHDGKPHHPGVLDCGGLAEELGIEIPEELCFTAGAQFNVSAEQIRQHPKVWYEKAYRISMEREKAPWEFERLWKYIFNL